MFGLHSLVLKIHLQLFFSSTKENSTKVIQTQKTHQSNNCIFTLTWKYVSHNPPKELKWQFILKPFTKLIGADRFDQIREISFNRVNGISVPFSTPSCYQLLFHIKV